MSSPRYRTQVVILALVMGVFVTGLVKLFLLRFDSGDVLPPYSSLRADPLGQKPFIKAWKTCRISPCPATMIPWASSTRAGLTLFYPGEHHFELNRSGRAYLEQLDSLAVGGGRLVISFFPSRRRRYSKQTTMKSQKKKSRRKKRRKMTGR